MPPNLCSWVSLGGVILVTPYFRVFRLENEEVFVAHIKNRSAFQHRPRMVIKPLVPELLEHIRIVNVEILCSDFRPDDQSLDPTCISAKRFQGRAQFPFVEFIASGCSDAACI